jgi:hypothetical protein
MTSYSEHSSAISDDRIPFDDFETTCHASVMFWGCITYYEVGTLVAIDGNMNTDKYISVLDDNLWPVVVRHFSDRPWIFVINNLTEN